MSAFSSAEGSLQSDSQGGATYTTRLVDRVFVVRWLDTPSPITMATLRSEVEAASRRLGKKVIYMAIIHAEEPPPEPPLRAAIYDFFRALQDPCDEMHLVVLGRGLKNSIIRSVITGGILANGLRKFISVHDSVEAAVSHIAPIERKSADSYLSQLRLAGFITA